jgi:protein SCO1/2
MFYASCPVACPVLLSELDRIANELPPDAARDVRIVVVSFDPRDTPERLATLARERKLDERWVLASASDLDARTLAAAIGFKYRKLDNGEYFHGSTILALDADGRPLAKAERLGNHEALVAVLR